MAKKTMTLELPDDATPQEVQKLTEVLQNKIEDLIDIDVVGFKKIEKKLTETDSNPSINKLGEVFSVGMGRATKAITEVERAIRSTEQGEKETENLLPILTQIEKNTKETQEYPTTPKNPIAVRLSDGTKWVEDLVKVISGGGGGGSRLQFKKTNGEEVQPTAVTSTSNSSVTSITVVNPDGSDITGTETPVIANALDNTPQTIKSTAGKIKSYYIFNPNASTAYVQLKDNTTIKWSIGIPAGSAANLSGLNLTFATSIKVTAATSATGSSAPSSSLDANFGVI